MPDKNSKVVIIGSGFAGLSAAKALMNAGWTDVKILEGRDYIGGRAVTHDIGDTGVLVDTGAAWIHGDKGNPLCGMCDHYGLKYVEHPEMKAGYASVVDTTPDGTRDEAWTEDELNRLITRFGRTKQYMRPGVGLKTAFYMYSAALAIFDEPDRRRTQFIMEQLTARVGAPSNDLNAHYPVNEITGRDAEGNDQLIVGGYSELVKKVAKGLDITLNAVVNKIEEVGRGIEITCKDGTEHMADYCIVTVPLGVLKNDVIEFSPALSEEKKAAISKLDMGNCEKVIMVFEEKFWEGFSDLKPWNGERIICNDLENNRRSCPMFIDITDKVGKPCIVCYYDGSFARMAQERWTDEEIVAKARTNLGIILDKADIPPCVATECTHWAKDEFSYGSYSFITTESSPEDMDVIAEPEWDGTLMFAGEHSIKEHNATVHGPVITGLREALRLDQKAFIDQVKPGPIPQTLN